MQRILRLLVIAGFVGLLVATGSYAGARVAAGKMLGPNPPVKGLATTFAYNGVQELPSKPRAWVLTYSRVQLPGVGRVKVYVSPSGRVLGAYPGDLDRRLEAYERSRQP